MRILAWLILTTAISLNVYAADDLITDINRKSANIEDLIQGQKLSVLSVRSDEESEGNPPEIRFYMKAGKLLAVRIATGHETWVSVITVYFYENGAPMKYLKLITGREKNPEREAIIYSQEGRVLWKNMEKPQVDIADILMVFHAIRTIRQSASQY